MKNLLLLILGLGILLGSQDKVKPLDQKPQVKSDVQRAAMDEVSSGGIILGVESIQANEDGTYTIAIFMTNDQPVAGFQLDIVPDNLFEISSIQDGRAEELGFMMKSGKTGRILGFSMQGTKIPASESAKLTDNILFTLTAKLTAEVTGPISFDLNTIIAGDRGSKLESLTEPFIWKPLPSSDIKTDNTK